MEFNWEHVKTIVTVIFYVLGIIGALYGFHKWIKPKADKFYSDSTYYKETGIHILKDIERNFGKEAGRVLKEIVQQRGLQIAIDEMRLNIIENAVGIGIYICDSAGMCTYANKTLAKIFGLSQEEMLGYGWITTIVDKQKAYSNWKFSVDNKVPYRDEYEIKNLEGIITCTTEAEPSYDDSETVILGYVGIVKIKQK